MASESLRTAIKQIQHASANLDNGVLTDWRGQAATLLGRLVLAIEFPGQYELAGLATDLDASLAKVGKK